MEKISLKGNRLIFQYLIMTHEWTEVKEEQVSPTQFQFNNNGLQYVFKLNNSV